MVLRIAASTCPAEPLRAFRGTVSISIQGLAVDLPCIAAREDSLQGIFNHQTDGALVQSFLCRTSGRDRCAMAGCNLEEELMNEENLQRRMQRALVMRVISPEVNIFKSPCTPRFWTTE